jgi:hypothetical protein
MTTTWAEEIIFLDGFATMGAEASGFPQSLASPGGDEGFEFVIGVCRGGTPLLGCR